MKLTFNQSNDVFNELESRIFRSRWERKCWFAWGSHVHELTNSDIVNEAQCWRWRKTHSFPGDKFHLKLSPIVDWMNLVRFFHLTRSHLIFVFAFQSRRCCRHIQQWTQRSLCYLNIQNKRIMLINVWFYFHFFSSPHFPFVIQKLFGLRTQNIHRLEIRTKKRKNLLFFRLLRTHSMRSHTRAAIFVYSHCRTIDFDTKRFRMSMKSFPFHFLRLGAAFDMETGKQRNLEYLFDEMKIVFDRHVSWIFWISFSFAILNRSKKSRRSKTKAKNENHTTQMMNCWR